MNQITTEQFIVAYNKLPEKIRMSLFDDRTTDEMGYIQEKHALSPLQINSLARVVGLTILGFAPIKDFLVNIKNFVDLDDDRAKYIARDVNERIFQPIREELLQSHGIQASGEAAQEETHGTLVAPVTPRMAPERPAYQPEPTEEHMAPVVPVKEDASQKREELLARLKAAQDVPITAPVPKTPPQESEPLKPVTAAWNGKTIDLSKIPPRRQLNGNGKNGAEEEIRTVQLKKGPDGYWYEV